MRNSNSGSSASYTSSSSSLYSRDWSCSMPWPNTPLSPSSRVSQAPSSSSCSAPQLPPPPHLPPSSSATAESLKLQGNAAFKSGDFATALSLYDEALSILPNDILLLSNRAAALTSLSRHAEALSVCALSLSHCALQSPPPSVVAKVYRRKALAHFQLRQLADAHGAYKHAQEIAEDKETERLIKKLESGSSDLVFSYAQKFYFCRKEIERKWRSFENRTIERIATIDLVETSRDAFDPGMRQRSLSGAVVQDIDSLKEVGTSAIPIFKALLTDVLTAVKLPVNYLNVAPLKGAERAVEKARDDYSKRVDGPGLSWLFDMVRGSVICKAPEEVERVVNHLVAIGCVVRLKNRFATPTPGGFRDFNLNIRVNVPGAKERQGVIHICELQVHVKALKEFGKEIGSHDVYDFFRKYFCGGTEAVEERLRLMDAVFGGEVEGGDLAKGKRATSFEEVIEQVCKEGDVRRMEAAAELAEAMCEYGFAEKVNIALLERSGRVGGAHSLKALMATSNLACTYSHQGKFVEALGLFYKALKGYLQALGSDHPSTLETMGNIGNALQKTGKHKEALDMYEKSLAGLVRSLGADHTTTLNTINNMGRALQDMGRYKEALDMHERALAGQTRALGLHHTSTLCTMGNVGGVLSLMGLHKEALEMYEKELAGEIRALGPDHTSTLSTTNNLGRVLQDMGRYKEALTMYERALSGQTRALGLDHLSTLMTMDNVGAVLQSVGKYKEALDIQQKALAGYTRTVGADHFSALTLMSNIGNGLQIMGRYKEALEIQEKALAGLMRTWGPDHPSTLEAISNIGNFLMNTGKYSEALAKYEKALAGLTRVLEPDHLSTLIAMGNIGAVLLMLERYDESLVMLEKTLACKMRSLGPNHTSTLETMLNIAVILEMKGKLDEATDIAAKAVEGLVKAVGSEHRNTIEAKKLHARLSSKIASSSLGGR